MMSVLIGGSSEILLGFPLLLLQDGGCHFQTSCSYKTSEGKREAAFSTLQFWPLTLFCLLRGRLLSKLPYFSLTRTVAIRSPPNQRQRGIRFLLLWLDHIYHGLSPRTRKGPIFTEHIVAEYIVKR